MAMAAAAAHAKRLPSADSTLIFTALVGGLQLAIVLLYCFGADYGDDAAAGSQSATPGQTAVSYAMFQDVNAMMYLGFGFLMSFMSRYTWTALGATYLIAAVTVQWNMLVAHFWHDLVAHGTVGKLALSIETLTTGNFGVAAVLISFGAIIGRVSPTQMIAMAVVEIIVYGLNEAIGVVVFQAVDMGGSMYVHIFGAFFGVAVSYMIGSAKHLGRNSSRHDEAMTSKTASTFAMIGTLLLWIYWPSFNGALATGAAQHRVVINTTLSLCGSCVAAFIGSRLLRGGKFSMEDIQNATLAGGVAIGSSADLVVLPGPAIIVGIVAGIVSVAGFAIVSPFLSRTFDLDDTCSVFSLHGMPGLIGGTAGAISAAVATTANYGIDVVTVFPARADGRTASGQAAYQAAALFVSLGMAIAGGLITGLILKLRVLGPLDAGVPMTAGVGLYEDERIWDMEDIEFSDPNAPYVDTAHEPHHHAHTESREALASSAAVEHIEMSDSPMKRPAAAAATAATSNGDGEVAAV